MKLLVFCVLMGAYSLPIWAQGKNGIGPEKTLFKIQKIKIEGLRKIEPEAILDKIKSSPGRRITNYQLRSDIKKIYEMQFFESVEAHQQGETLVFKIKEKPIVKKIFIEGNDEIGDDELKEQISLKEFNIINVSNLKNDVVTIQKMYEEKGYYLSQVDYEIKPVNNETVVVTFSIKEFDKVKVKKVTFLGNKDLPDDELKNFMMTQEDSTFSGLSDSGSFKEFNFQADIERLSYYYRTKGYLQVNVGNPVITVSEDRKWIFITLNITEGPQYEVREINYRGDLLFTESELAEKTSLKTGETYSEESLRKDIQNLTEMYQDLGYAFVNVLRTLTPVEEDGKNKVDINFSFEKGKIAYFGNINVRGNTKTRDKVVRRELRILEGMKFSGSKLRISKENVNRLGFFEPGSVVFNTVSRKNRDNILDVNISVKERQTGQISIGAGYSTGTRGFLQASIRQNNFRGLGQNLNFNLSFSDVEQNYSLGLTEPYFNDTQFTVGGLVYRNRSTLVEDYTFVKEGGEVRVGYPIFEYTRLFVTYGLEETEVKNAPNPSIVEEDENGIASGVEVSLVTDKRNNAFEPTDGYYTRFAVEYVGLGFDQRWLSTQIDGRIYQPIWNDLIFRSRLRVSQLFETSENRNIPRTEKYQMGGARNLRGYVIGDIGPQREFTDPATSQPRLYNVGGLHSVLGTIELEHPLVREAGLKWAVFYDFGNVFEDYIGKDGDYSMKQDWGFGVRWFSPIGVLRFEFGYPINREDGISANQFFFDIGQIF